MGKAKQSTAQPFQGSMSLIVVAVTSFRDLQAARTCQDTPGGSLVSDRIGSRVHRVYRVLVLFFNVAADFSGGIG